jgi:hypothetical protein
VPKSRLGMLIPEPIPASCGHDIQEPAITFQISTLSKSLSTLMACNKTFENLGQNLHSDSGRYWHLNVYICQNQYILLLVHYTDGDASSAITSAQIRSSPSILLNAQSTTHHESYVCYSQQCKVSARSSMGGNLPEESWTAGAKGGYSGTLVTVVQKQWLTKHGTAVLHIPLQSPSFAMWWFVPPPAGKWPHEGLSFQKCKGSSCGFNDYTAKGCSWGSHNCINTDTGV